MGMTGGLRGVYIYAEYIGSIRMFAGCMVYVNEYFGM